jgi:putative iron-regulated protein
MNRWVFSGVLVLTTAIAACSSDSDTSTGTGGGAGPDKKAVLANYAQLVHQNYADSLSGMRALKAAVDAFAANPSEATLDAARKAWVAARPAYGQSEVYRFYGGPIDDDDGPEGRINGWPIDENFIDYVKDDASAGIINKVSDFASITNDLIKTQNEEGGEKNLSAGWHAIEFLLWGQDFNEAGPGNRPFTDYVTGGSGTAQNQDRRAQYLADAVDLMIQDMESVEVEWRLDNPQSYASQFVNATPDESLTKMITGMGSLSGSELPKERMDNAYETKDQEEEHSCFSDTTTQDLLANAQGIENVYLGKYGSIDGVGIDELVKAVNPELDTKMKTQLTAALDAVRAIPAPFDQAILGDDGAPGRQKIKAAIDALGQVAATTVEVATALKLTINLE